MKVEFGSRIVTIPRETAGHDDHEQRRAIRFRWRIWQRFTTRTATGDSRKENSTRYRSRLQAQADYKKTAEKDVKSFVQNWEFPYGVEMATNSQDESMGEELSALGMALVTAIFLIFIVMAIQFESPKFSLWLLATIPFS